MCIVTCIVTYNTPLKFKAKINKIELCNVYIDIKFQSRTYKVPVLRISFSYNHDIIFSNVYAPKGP